MQSIFRLVWMGVLMAGYVHASAQLPPGSQAPSLELPDVSGQKVSLNSLRGKWVLIDFWASWCMPCRASNRTVRKLYPDWKRKGVEVFGVSLDEDRSAWLKAIRQDKITWVQVNTPGQWDSPIIQQWQFDRIPTTYLIDPNGVIRATDPDPKSVMKLISGVQK